MKNLYEEEDYTEAKKLKSRLLTIYFIALAVAVCGCAVLFVFFMLLPYPSNDVIEGQKNLYLFGVTAISVVFVIFSFIYLGIPYKRAKKYFAMFEDIKTGQKQYSVCTFLQNDLSVSEVRDVEFHTMVVLEWSDKTQEYMRRNVLVDKEKQMPQLKNGDIIKIMTHANVLLSYGLNDEEEPFEEN
ncbi:MAG: hypothetical protein IJ800_07045 [Clostridia bacterium]|nr:hypothetical protein [Clostridia bacterium]